MFAEERLKTSAETRQLLVLQSDLHRSVIQAECASLRERWQGVMQVRNAVTANKPLVIAGAAVAGFIAIRHWRSLARWAPSAIAAWRWFRAWRGKN